MCWVYLLKDKSETSHVLEIFYSMIKTQYDSIIRFFRTDDGTEFFNYVINAFLSIGFIHQSSCTNTPQQNGVSEWKNRHLLEVSRSLLFTSNVRKYFLGNALHPVF